MDKNIDLARECGALFPVSVDLVIFTPDQLDAFAERIRAEAPADRHALQAARQPLTEAAISHCINRSTGRSSLARIVEQQCALAWGVQLAPQGAASQRDHNK